MQVRKGTAPATIERKLSVDLTREEVLAVVVNYVKSKLGPNVTFDDIQVAGDENDKLQGVTINGVEIVPLQWKPDEANKLSQPALATPSVPLTGTVK